MSRSVAPLTAEESAAFLAAARGFLTSGKVGGRAEFGHCGRLPHKVDCIGLVVLSLKAVGREVSDRKDYGRDPSRDGLREVLRSHLGEPVWRKGQPLDLLRPGYVLLMRWHMDGPTNLFNHVGVVTEAPYGGLAMVHSLQANKQVIEHRLADPWPRRIVEAYKP